MKSENKTPLIPKLKWNRSLKVVIITELSLILILALVSAIYGNLGAGRIIDNAQIIQRKTFPSLELAESLYREVLNTRNSLKEAYEERDKDILLELDAQGLNFTKMISQIRSGTNVPELDILEQNYQSFSSTGRQLVDGLIDNEGRFVEDGVRLRELFEVARKLGVDIQHYRGEKRQFFAQSLDSIEEESRRFKTIFSAVSLLLLIIVTAILIVTRRQLNVIKTLVGDAERLQSGDLTTMVPVNRHDELGILQLAFEDMRLSVKGSIDNLDRKVLEKTKRISELLDTIDQGIITVGPDLVLFSEHSNRATSIFDVDNFAGRNLREIFRCNKQTMDGFKRWLEISSSSARLKRWSKYETLCPVKQLHLHQGADERYIRLEYRPIVVDGKLDRLMILGRDVTASIEAEKALQQTKTEQSLLLERVFALISGDHSDAGYFLDNSRQMLLELRRVGSIEGLDRVSLDALRDLHTLKGDAGSFSFHTLASLASKAEDLLIKYRSAKNPSRDISGWHEVLTLTQSELDGIRSLKSMIFTDSKQIAHVDRGLYEQLKVDLEQRTLMDTELILQRCEALDSQSLFEYTRKLQNTLHIYRNKTGKNISDLVLKNPERRLLRKHWNQFDGSLIHILRNALDHGLESNEERKHLSKGEGMVSIDLEIGPEQFTLMVTDNGRGINPESIYQHASEAGLLSTNSRVELSYEEKLDLIFLPEFSTKAEMSELSGRGMGLSAARKMIDKWGGQLSLKAKLGEGTTFTITLPL